MTVSITNKAPMPFDVTLYHDIFCTKTGECSCTEVERATARQMADGTVRSKQVKRRLPKTLSLAPRKKRASTIDGLPDAILELPQIKYAEKHRQILVRRIANPPQAKPAPQTPPKSQANTAPSSPAPEKPSQPSSGGGRRSSARNRTRNRS